MYIYDIKERRETESSISALEWRLYLIQQQDKEVACPFPTSSSPLFLTSRGGAPLHECGWAKWSTCTNGTGLRGQLVRSLAASVMVLWGFTLGWSLWGLGHCAVRRPSNTEQALWSAAQPGFQIVTTSVNCAHESVPPRGWAVAQCDVMWIFNV